MVRLLCVLFTIGLSHLYCQEIDDDTLGVYDTKFFYPNIISPSVDSTKGYVLPRFPKINEHDKLSKNAMKYLQHSPTRSEAFGSIVKITNKKKRFQLKTGISQSTRSPVLCQKVFLSIDSVMNYDSSVKYFDYLDITYKPDSIFKPFVMWFPVIKKRKLSIYSVFKYSRFEYYLYEEKNKSYRIAADYPFPER
jgi:hypothetical protein